MAVKNESSFRTVTDWGKFSFQEESMHTLLGIMSSVFQQHSSMGDWIQDGEKFQHIKTKNKIKFLNMIFHCNGKGFFQKIEGLYDKMKQKRMSKTRELGWSINNGNGIWLPSKSESTSLNNVTAHILRSESYAKIMTLADSNFASGALEKLNRHARKTSTTTFIMLWPDSYG